MKTCTKCGEIKETSQFHSRKDAKDGLRNFCKSCHNAHYKAKFDKNPETKLASNRKHYENNKGYYNAKMAKRRAAKMLRTVSWADLEAINDKYNTARYMTELTGVQYHVDHIIPLQGETVSGLHVEYNLRVVTARENLSKGNLLIDITKEMNAWKSNKFNQEFQSNWGGK